MPRQARFFPELIHEELRSNPSFRAEVRFYDLLDQQMPSGWTVFYDVGWLSRRFDDLSVRDGQTDFVLAHPVHGVLVIELKGGLIGFDGVRQQWLSTDSGRVTHDITNPFYQAKKGKYDLRDRLQELLGRAPSDIRLYHAVAFPDSDGPTEWITPEADPGIIIGRQDLTHLLDRINYILAHSQGSAAFSHGPEIVNGLVRLLARTTTLPNPLRSQIETEHVEIQTLTNSQIDLFRRLQGTRRLAIGGGAGSGKTYVAIQRARDLARQGLPTLLVCYGEHLACFLKSLIGTEPNLEAMSARELTCRYVPGLNPKDPEADDLFPGKLLDAMAAMSRRPYEAVLVDEGQDFTADWFVALESCLLGGKRSIFYVFHDTNNQVIRPNRGQIPQDLLTFNLEENVRNTQCICRTMQRYYLSDVPMEPRGPEGRAVEFHACPDATELKQRLSEVLTRLLLVENLLAKEIVVLTSRDPVDGSALAGLGWPHGIRLVTDSHEVRARNVLLSSIADFKGLERPVVLVAELDEHLPSEPRQRASLFYVAFSRPRNFLSVFATPSILEEVKPSLR